MDVPLAILRGLGRQAVRGKRADELGGELDGVHELALRRPGVHREPANGHSHRRRGERLGLELSERRSVQGVRDVRAEGVEVEVLRPPADLLVDGERDPDRSSIPLGMPHEVRERTHDLRDPGLVVRTEQGRAVAGDDVVTDPGGELGQLFRVENLPCVAWELDRRFHPRPRARSARRPPLTTSGVVSTWAMSPTTGAPFEPGRPEKTAEPSVSSASSPSSRSSSRRSRDSSSCFSVLGRSVTR